MPGFRRPSHPVQARTSRPLRPQRKFRPGPWALALVGLLLAGCQSAGGAGGGGAASQRLTVTGSSTVAPLAAEIAKRFETSQPDARVDVQSGGSSKGLADVRRGSADLGMVSRALGPEEDDLQATTIALDGIALIVHSDNPLPALSEDQIRGIFTGAITDWRQVGGPPAPITVINKADGRSTLELFLDHFQLSSADIQADVVIGDNQQGIRSVVGNPAAISYVSIGSALQEAGRGGAIRLLPLGGIAPTLANVANGSFPLSRPLILVRPARGLTPLGQEFLAFAASATNDDLIRRESFVAPPR